MNLKLSDLWRWDGPLSGRNYFGWGLLLAIIKYNLDRLIAAVWFGDGWTLLDAETVKLYLWQSPLKEAEKPYFLVLLVVSLPFLWAGTVLTVRRLRGLGWRPFWVLLFFVPVVKFVFFATLCILRSREESRVAPGLGLENSWDRFGARVLPSGALASAVVAVVLTAVLSILAAWLGTEVLRDYGWTMFVGLPFFMGFNAALIDSFRAERTLGRCILLANLTALLVGVGLLAVALEGVFCLIMAAPIAFGIATLGGMMGYAVQKTFWWRETSPRLFCSVLLLVPLMMGVEHAAPPALPLLAVKTSVVVDAPPEKVWRNVVSFSQLPPPTETIFKMGVAYPVRAEIVGHGVGAIRTCHFSTGPFVEPITAWDEPNLLRFSVRQNPEPMQEWTPYRVIHPPHLDGYLESRAGQFRLEPLAGGRTLLEGTTWYHHHLWPADYWQLWSDEIIHRIHLRVLNHVKNLSEMQGARN